MIHSNLKFLHQTLHTDTIQHSRIYQRLLYTIFHIELLLIINKNCIPKNMEPILLSTIDIIQLQLNDKICFVIHLIILFLYIYSFIYQQLIGIQFTLHTYFYILSNFILLAVFTHQQNSYEIAFKIVNFMLFCLINSSYTYMSLSDQYFETNPFLFRYNNLIYQILSFTCYFTSLILSVFNYQLLSQICLISFYIFHFINLDVFQINTIYQATINIMGVVIISTLWIIETQNNYKYTNKNDAIIIFMTAFTFFINIYNFIIKEYQTHITLNPKKYQLEILKYQQLINEQYDYKNLQFMNLLISQNLDSQQIIDERIKQDYGSQEYLQIVTFLLKTQPIRAFTFLEMHNAQFSSLYVEIAISTLKQLFKNQQQEQLLEPAYVYQKFQSIQKNIDNLFLLVQMKIRYLNQLQSNLIEKDVLFQSSFDFGKLINESQFDIPNPDTFQELKFLEIYHFLILNNQQKMKKYAKQVLQQSLKDSLDLKIEKSKSLFLSFDNLNFDIKSISKEKLIKFTNYKENLYNIKQIMPKFIGERHDDLIRFFLSSGKSALLEQNFKTFYTDSEFIYPCSIQQFLTSTQNQLNILINKVDDTNSYILFDIFGMILEFTHDLDLEKNNNIFNYLDIKHNLEILKNSIKQQDIYILNNLQSTLYWNYCKLNSQQSTTLQQGSQDENSKIQWPLLSQQFFNNQLEMNREIYYSLSFHTLGKSVDKYQYFQITIHNDMSAQTSSHSSTFNQIANLMYQINQQTPKLLENKNKQTTLVNRTTDHSPINNTQIWSPINSKLLANNQAVTYSDNKNKFNLQGSECSFASTRQDNIFSGLVENPQLNIIKIFRATISLIFLILFVYGTLQMFLAQSQINHQINFLSQVGYVQQLNYRYLQRFYAVYSLKEQNLGLFQLNNYSKILFNQEISKLETEIDKFKLSNQIFVLTNSEEIYIHLQNETMNIFQFYNMFYLDILEGLRNNFAIKFMLEFIVFNDDTIDGIVNSVDSEFETLLQPLNIIMILFNCFLFLLILFEVKIQIQICQINRNILLATLQLDQQAIQDQIELCQIFVKYKEEWTKISYLDYIQINDKKQQGIKQIYKSQNFSQNRQIFSYAIIEEIEAEKINFKSLIHIILQIILIVIIMLSWFIYIDLQIKLLQGYFQFNYKSTQVQQHFIASINQGELIKTHGILYNYDNYELLDNFAHHFVALIPEQMSELVKYVLEMNIGQKMVDMINNDMCQFTKLFICDTPYHFLVSQGLLGFTSEFMKSITSQYYIEINEQRYQENTDEQISYLQSTDHIYYFLYFMMDISQVVQELIDYSYQYIKDSAQNIFQQFYILMFSLYTPILFIVFILLILQINKQKLQLICLFKILYLIGEDQQQKTKIKHLLRTLKKQIN